MRLTLCRNHVGLTLTNKLSLALTWLPPGVPKLAWSKTVIPLLRNRVVAVQRTVNIGRLELGCLSWSRVEVEARLAADFSNRQLLRAF
jgi:hypothetical protein